MTQDQVGPLLLVVVVAAFAAAVIVPSRTTRVSDVEAPSQLWAAQCQEGESDITEFVRTSTGILAHANKAWKQQCPDTWCGAPSEKSVSLTLICLRGIGDREYAARALARAEANFGYLSPLQNIQHVMVLAEVNFRTCHLRLRKNIAFRQAATGLVSAIFVGAGDQISIRDSERGGQCKHYLPVQLR